MLRVTLYLVASLLAASLLTGCVASLLPTDPPAWEGNIAPTPNVDDGGGVYYRNATSDTTLSSSLFDMLVGGWADEAGSVESIPSTFDRDCV